ncbi:hypothetical protein V6N13_074925 [Hibiscus sabdariffa]|uniref:Uncharacterized protein n=1 Tax=Hibiscus sabdariffa TaxID=183260 RepID=A0ABR2UA63_9ROSI
MGKKMIDLGTTTNQTVCTASQKIHLRSRKPKIELGKGKPKQRFERKDKKKKHKTLGTQVAKLLDEFPPMFAAIRASNQQAKELMSEIDARILTQLKAWDDKDNGF